MNAEEARQAAIRPAVRLWLASPANLLDEDLRERWCSLLPDEDRGHVQGFHFAARRREAIMTRALLRIALSSAVSRPPDSWKFLRNAWGKPAVADGGNWRFNLSNAAGLVACVVAHGDEVGVDVESCERSREIAELRDGIFSDREMRQLQELPGVERLDRALSLWTLKEAWSKALGRGFSLPLRRISFLIGERGALRIETEGEPVDCEDHAWCLGLLDHRGHRIALAVECGEVPELEIREAGPEPGDSTVSRVRAEWFPGIRIAPAGPITTAAAP